MLTEEQKKDVSEEWHKKAEEFGGFQGLEFGYQGFKEFGT